MIGYTLASLGLLILAFSFIALPLSSSYVTTWNFTSPPWFTRSVIHVHNGSFVFTNSTTTLLLNSSFKLKTSGTFSLKGEGNASIIFHGVRLFYGFYPRLVGYLLTGIGAFIEAYLLAKRMKWVRFSMKEIILKKVGRERRKKEGKKTMKKGKQKKKRTI